MEIKKPQFFPTPCQASLTSKRQEPPEAQPRWTQPQSGWTCGGCAEAAAHGSTDGAKRRGANKTVEEMQCTRSAGGGALRPAPAQGGAQRDGRVQLAVVPCGRKERGVARAGVFVSFFGGRATCACGGFKSFLAIAPTSPAPSFSAQGAATMMPQRNGVAAAHRPPRPVSWAAPASGEFSYAPPGSGAGYTVQPSTGTAAYASTSSRSTTFRVVLRLGGVDFGGIRRLRLHGAHHRVRHATHRRLRHATHTRCCRLRTAPRAPTDGVPLPPRRSRGMRRWRMCLGPPRPQSIAPRPSTPTITPNTTPAAATRAPGPAKDAQAAHRACRPPAHAYRLQQQAQQLQPQYGCVGGGYAGRWGVQSARTSPVRVGGWSPPRYQGAAQQQQTGLGVYQGGGQQQQWTPPMQHATHPAQQHQQQQHAPAHHTQHQQHAPQHTPRLPRFLERWSPGVREVVPSHAPQVPSHAPQGLALPAHTHVPSHTLP
ncbi:hypothetical protein C8J57DRAFT_1483529 [Mycena rebaudengoi]|nr:hypothetical protein C8J57DRAFT_1483529 [Mycena rebaudengoi]